MIIAIIVLLFVYIEEDAWWNHKRLEKRTTWLYNYDIFTGIPFVVIKTKLGHWEKRN